MGDGAYNVPAYTNVPYYPSFSGAGATRRKKVGGGGS